MYHALPNLRTATSLTDETGTVSREYKNGAKFHGEIANHKKCGHGTFVWPNGAKYIGDYKDNARCGEGTQYWPDESVYTGQFLADLRHGQGTHYWSNGESYKGEFYRDRRHGNGTYIWPDGREYEGPFYVEKKQGYGRFTFPDGRLFQGLYKDDEREGPGILTYPGGSTQDVGLWRRERIIKLCSKVEGCFTMDDHPEYEYEKDNTLLEKYIENEQLRPASKSPFDYGQKSANDVAISRVASSLKSEALDPHSAALDHVNFTERFFQSLTQTTPPSVDMKVVNKTPSMIRMQKHILRHQPYQSTELNVDKILVGDRSGFGEKGALELGSEELLRAAMTDDMARVVSVLDAGRIHVDAADSLGRTPLLGAVISWNTQMINCLLDHGADINQVTDEGVSPLAACAVFLYPQSRFIPNTAEKTLVKVPPVVPEPANTKVPLGGGVKTKNQDKLDKRKVNQVNLSIDLAGNEASEYEAVDENSVKGILTPDSEFASNASLRLYGINVTDQLRESGAEQLSTNPAIVRRHQLDTGTMHNMAVHKHLKILMDETIRLLLKRGADPNASCVPMPVLFFALKAGDVEMVKLLLLKRASSGVQLSHQYGGLCPLHIAVAIPGEGGVQMTELLLNSLADPDARASLDESYITKIIPEEIWCKDPISDFSRSILGGRTPLHIACARDDDHKRCSEIVHMLLSHHANPNVLCNGHSPLSLAITSGNDLAIDELLKFAANPSLTLTHGVGTALCVAFSTEHEHRRPIEGRLKLVEKLVKAGANILAPVLIGAKRTMGTAVDFGYYMFNLDRRVAHVPYHALTPAERTTFNERMQLLAYGAEQLRQKYKENERRRLEEERLGGRSRDMSTCFDRASVGDAGSLHDISRRPSFRFCYECGRSVGVRLTPCTRCKQVYFCSKSCKLKSWSTRHKDECVRVVGDSSSEDDCPAPPPRLPGDKRTDSPTPATDLENKAPVTVSGLMSDVNNLRNLAPMRNRSKSSIMKSRRRSLTVTIAPDRSH